LTDDAGNSQEQTFAPLFYYGDAVGIEEETSRTSVLAYPNPFTGNVTIEIDNPVSGEVYFEVYDVTGRIIHQEKMNCNLQNSFIYNGSHLKEGVYFYGIYGNEGVVKGKIVKQ
jgi:hypothetical protein